MSRRQFRKRTNVPSLDSDSDSESPLYAQNKKEHSKEDEGKIEWNLDDAESLMESSGTVLLPPTELQTNSYDKRDEILRPPSKPTGSTTRLSFEDHSFDSAAPKKVRMAQSVPLISRPTSRPHGLQFSTQAVHDTYTPARLEELRRQSLAPPSSAPSITDNGDAIAGVVPMDVDEHAHAGAASSPPSSAADFIPLDTSRPPLHNATVHDRSATHTIILDDEAEDELLGEEDDALQRWEEELIRKGAGYAKPANGKAGTKREGRHHKAVADFMFGDEVGLASREIAMETEIPPRSLSMATAPSSGGGQFTMATVDEFMRQLRGRQATLVETKKNADARVAGIEEDISLAKSTIQKLSSELGKTDIDGGEAERPMGSAAEKLMYFQQLREYVTDLAGFMSEKGPKIEQLEKEYTEAQERARAVRWRRMMQRWRESGPAAPADWSDSEGEQAESERDGGAEPYDPFNASDESTPRRSKEEVVQEASQLFSDAADEFGDIQQVRQHLEQWKYRYYTSYIQAYAFATAPKIFAPFVRRDLVVHEWDPLGDKSLDEMPWVAALFGYGMARQMEQQGVDEDSELIPKLVETLAYRWLMSAISSPGGLEAATFSRRRTAAARNRLAEILEFLGANRREKRDALLAAVHVALAGAVERLPRPIPTEPSGDRIAWRAVKVGVNILNWLPLLPAAVIHPLVWDGLVNSRLLPFMRHRLTLGHRTAGVVLRQCEKLISACSSTMLASGGAGLLQDFISNTLRHSLSVVGTVEEQARLELLLQRCSV